MFDYSAMSDQQINEMVAIALGEKVGEPVNGQQLVMVDGEKISSSFDPCNNLADAWPIIVEAGIGIWPSKKDPYAWDLGGGMLRGIKHSDKNPLRAAMVVFLMMKDAQSKN